MIPKKKKEPVPGEMTEDEVNNELEDGLKESFPASDPPAATQPVHKPPHTKRDE